MKCLVCFCCYHSKRQKTLSKSIWMYKRCDNLLVCHHTGSKMYQMVRLAWLLFLLHSFLYACFNSRCALILKFGWNDCASACVLDLYAFRNNEKFVCIQTRGIQTYILKWHWFVCFLVIYIVDFVGGAFALMVLTSYSFFLSLSIDLCSS